MFSCLFTISYPNLTASLQSHNSYSASVILNVRSMYGLQEVCECPEIVCKIVFMYVLSGEACQIWGGVEDSKARQILYKAPLQYPGTMQLGKGTSYMPR